MVEAPNSSAPEVTDGVARIDADTCDRDQLKTWLAELPEGTLAVVQGRPATLQRVRELVGPDAVLVPDTMSPFSVERLLQVLRRQQAEMGSVRDRHSRMEVELRHAQKMDAVGQLASGIAHEINTPIQFVGDSVFFLQGAFDDLVRLTEVARAAAGDDPDVRALAEDIDLEFILAEIPRAFERTRGGCDRVSTIVRAMRHFARDDHGTRAAADLVGALQSTVVVASNELKLVADVQTDMEPLPQVVCLVGDLNQVFLNLLVNAAHAIADAGCDRGTIGVSTRDRGDHVEIRISDTGCGIPLDVRDRVFEPFFTTKEVGRGTGQGLAISHAIVVERHGGELFFESEVGVGTTFVLKLPVQPTSALAGTT
ncbi:MAG: HAMP domain-containing histidine kinase [Myxococcales bacterium]|nr:HAMP domain-containing histidine kinase [Myxococcales bacterium]